MNTESFAIDSRRNDLFFLYCEKHSRIAKKMRSQKLAASSSSHAIVVKAKRLPPSVFTDRKIDFWSTVWGMLIVNLSSIENGPSIDSRAGKLFRRRFRVPWQVYLAMVDLSALETSFSWLV